ncbi:MAG: 2-oxoacid:acceptor oxidoreductase family protein [Deltaproteobacteria bacterium]|nr:2-oxoacid:acceptor oxidoreductase family protein [Deltaproteobacteria bacterium]
MKDKNYTYEVILAGSGGQGLVSSGLMLGEAAILEGKNVMQTTSYGIAQRGGLSMAEVIISDGEILFQHVQNPDVVLALTDDSMNLYIPLAEQGVPIFYDTTLVEKREGENLYGYPLTEMANELGHSGVANVIALGAMITKSGMIKIESLEKMLQKRFKGKAVDMNVTALRKGVTLVTG